MPNLSVIHIEDEYEEFESVVQFVAYWLEGFCEDRSGFEYLMAKVTLSHSCKKTPPSWIVYDIIIINPETQDAVNDYLIRYIFIRERAIPKAVVDFFVGERVFILDVLRPEAGQTELEVSIFDTIKSINENRNFYKPSQNSDLYEDVVIFTAYQGSELDSYKGALPKIIDKSSEHSLEEFITMHVGRVVSNG